jgi:hypothetical protein
MEQTPFSDKSFPEAAHQDAQNCQSAESLGEEQNWQLQAPYHCSETTDLDI